FATGAKTIMNKPVVNEVVNDKAMLKRYEKKIKDLQLQLLERVNRRKTWCPSSSKNLKRLSFELPRADQSLNIQTPTSLHDESFDSRQFQLECLLEEDEDKSLILTPEDMQDKGRHSYNKDMGKMDMTVQTSFTENPTDTPSAKTPVSRVLSKSVVTPSSELRAQMCSLICLRYHELFDYEELNKDYKELQEFTKFEKDFGVRDKWEKEQKLKIKDQLDLASEEIQSLEKNNDDLEQVVNDLQLQIDWERERNLRVMTSLQEEIIKPLVTENTDLKKTIKEAEVKLTILEKEKNDQCIGFEIVKHNMERQIMELRASFEEALGSSKSEEAPTGKELQLKLVLLQEEHKTTNEKLANQESTYKTDIESLRNQLSVKESQILEEIAARQSAEALTKQLQLELQGYTERISSASRGTKRISCSPIREDTSVNKSLKQVQKKLKLEHSFDESTLSNLEGDKNFEHFPCNEFEQLKEKLEAQNELLKQQIEEREKAERLIKDLNEDLSLQKAVETERKETLCSELEQLKEELEVQKELSKQQIEEREKAERLVKDLNEDLSLQKAVETERKETLCSELEQLKEELEVQKELSKQKIEEREKAEKLIKDLNENLSLQKTVETELKETLCSELEHLKEELVAQKELLKQQTEEREKAEKLIKDLNEDLSYQKAVETKLKETLETLSDEYEKLRSEIKSREARIELLTKANKELNENLRNMKEDNEHRETTQDNLRTDIELFDQEKLISKNRLSVLEKEKKELEQTIEGLTEEMKISQSEKNTLRLSLENYQTEVKCLKERVDDHTSVVSKMQQDLDKHQNDKLNLKKRIDLLESELNKRQKEIENLLQSLEMEKNGTLSLKQLLETANIEKKEIEVSMEQHMLKSTQLQQDIDSLLCEKSNFEAKLKLLEAEEIEKQK
ncbi:centromere-associated protein E-like, partial [Artemia franciscana]|uniref:centromere-associated protein E-like n=1 Tax=Artemia franciscana TaxID=6661 RepID=UPI0032DACE36